MAWSGDCPRCGVSQVDVAALLRQGCAVYERARAAAAAGRYAEANLHLTELRRVAIPALLECPAVRRLTELCALVGSGGDPARAEYDAARRAARDGDWPAAAAAAGRSVKAAPACLPARKLHLLCLFAAGHAVRAERLRGELVADAPGDPELARWRFAPEPPPGRRRAARREATGTTQRRARPDAGAPRRARADRGSGAVRPLPLYAFWVGGLALSGLIVAVCALVVAVGAALRQPAAAGRPENPAADSASPPTSSPPMPAATPPAVPTAAGGAVRPASVPPGFEAIRREASERQARVWFNAAIRARQDGRMRDAMALAAAAFQAGPSTYLADEALLIRAQCADNLNYQNAAEAYARLAAERPSSAYAPLALLQAARVARRQGRSDEAGTYIAQLCRRYPRSPQAAMGRMDISSAGESSKTNDHGQRQ